MKKNYEEIDQMIKEALTEEEARFYDELGEQSLPEMVGGLFQGKLKWLSILTVAMMPILFAAGVYCAVQFFNAAEIREMLIWGSGAFLFIFATGFLKVYHWMQMDKNALLREIKRLELQVATLNGKVKSEV